jgi:hypothetical protein
MDAPAPARRALSSHLDDDLWRGITTLQCAI